MANQKSNDVLEAYLKEHLKYERDMLRFTYGMLFQTDGYRWCAMFESFGVHARNMYDFLRHKGESNTIRADDYVRGRSRPAWSNVDGKMNTSFFHLSTSRLKNNPVNLEDAVAIGSWIDREWTTWVSQLKEPFTELVDATPACPPPQLKAPPIPSATAHLTSTSTTISYGDLGSNSG